MRVIVGVDGSDQAMAALEVAIERARETGDELTVAVYSPDGPVAATETRVRERLSELAFDAPVTQLESDPGASLVSRAETDGYDRIVLPGGNRSPVGKIQFDSTIEFVLLNADTTVILIR